MLGGTARTKRVKRYLKKNRKEQARKYARRRAWKKKNVTEESWEQKTGLSHDYKAKTTWSPERGQGKSRTTEGERRT